MGTTKFIIIALLLLFFFGGKKVPEFIRGLNEALKEFRKAVKDDNEKKKR